jgi:hypothetical protein
MSLTCPKYGRVYPISNGIPNMAGLHLARSLSLLLFHLSQTLISRFILATGQNMSSVFLVSIHRSSFVKNEKFF